MSEDKSPLRLARERAGLSRKAIAEKLGTTEHHYWHCEMPPFDGPADVLQRACELLGVATSPQGTPRKSVREAPREPQTWRCPKCGATTKQPASASEVGHSCYKTGSAQYVKMILVTE